MRSATLSGTARTAVLSLGLLVGGSASLKAQGPPADIRERFRKQAEAALAEPFKGVTADGKIVPGLYRVQATGVSTEPVVLAAEKFLAGLTEGQRDKVLFPVEDAEWRMWDNRHISDRQGIAFEQMTEEQRALAFELFGAGLSAKGLAETQDIMKLNETLAELTAKPEEYGQWLYWVSIMGTPSATEPWGWQLDGHHCIINYFVLGDQVVMSPVFMGSEPIRAEAGKFQGTVVLQDEQDMGLSFMQSLTEKQQAQARIATEKGPTNNLGEAYHDNLVLDYAGLRGSDLTQPQREGLLEVVREYVGRMREGHAEVRMEEVRKHLDDTWFAWIGEAEIGGVFYYRIHSPVILIEFDHQRPIALGKDQVPTPNHIHTVVRTPNGNDYGKDLLRQHYAKEHGSKP